MAAQTKRGIKIIFLICVEENALMLLIMSALSLYDCPSIAAHILLHPQLF